MKKLLILILTITLVTFLVSCDMAQSNSNDEKLNIITTTTMLYDLVNVIGGDLVQNEGLCAAGVDPHLYKATAGDIAKINNADVVIYNGFNLEGKMGDVFSSIDNIICVETGLIGHSSLILDDNVADEFDPHIWFDVALWKDVAIYITTQLALLDSDNSVTYQQNLAEYIVELDELELYIQEKIALLPVEQRVLITAHDAFNYFGNAYGFNVIGLQGINTQTEASTLDISELASFIVENKIKAIFVESSVPIKNIIALQEAVQAQGFTVEIGGELYSDSLGDITSMHSTYITTVKANIDTIVGGLL